MIPILLLFMGGFFLFFSPAKAQDTFSITLLAPLSGSLKDMGQQSLAGIQLALDDINCAGGLLGKKIKLFLVDSPLQPEVAAHQAAIAIREGEAQAILQVGPSSVARALMDVAQRNQVVLVSLAGAEEDRLTGKGFVPYFFRTCLTTRNRSQAYAEFFRTKPWRKFYLIHGEGPVRPGLVEDFKHVMKEELPGFEVVGEDFPPGGENDDGVRVRQIRRSRAEIVFTEQRGSGLESLIREAARMEIKARFATYFLDEPFMITNLGQAAEGSWVLSGYLPMVDTPQNQRFVMRWNEKRKDTLIPWPTSSIGVAYQGTQFFFQAVRKAKALDAEAIIRAWEGMADDGLVGRLFMRPCDHQTLMPAVIGEIQSRSVRFSSPFPAVPIMVPMDKVSVSFEKTANPRCK